MWWNTRGDATCINAINSLYRCHQLQSSNDLDHRWSSLGSLEVKLGALRPVGFRGMSSVLYMDLNGRKVCKEQKPQGNLGLESILIGKLLSPRFESCEFNYFQLHTEALVQSRKSSKSPLFDVAVCIPQIWFKMIWHDIQWYCWWKKSCTR